MPNPKNAPQHLMTAQVLTAGWVNIGGPIETAGAEAIAIWIALTIGTCTDVRVRALGRMSLTDANVYTLPIRTITATVVRVEAEFMEFNVDATQNMILDVQTDQVVPYVQFQIQTGAVGGAPGNITAWTTQKVYVGQQ